MAVDDDQAFVVVVDTLSSEVIVHVFYVFILFHGVDDAGSGVADGIEWFGGNGRGSVDSEKSFERSNGIIDLYGIESAAVALFGKHVDGEGFSHLLAVIIEFQVIVYYCCIFLASLQFIRSRVGLDNYCRIARNGSYRGECYSVVRVIVFHQVGADIIIFREVYGTAADERSPSGCGYFRLVLIFLDA